MIRIVHLVLLEINELNRLRIERDLTYETLAKGIGVALPTVYRILNVPNPHVHDRTLYKIQRFLERARRKGL